MRSRPKAYHPANADEAIGIFSRHRALVDIKAKFASRLLSAGVPENSISELTDSVVRRMLEGRMRGKGVEFERLKWLLTWEIVASHVFSNVPESRKRRLRLFSDRLAELGLSEKQRTAAFYVVWGLGNKEIGEKIHRSLDTAKARVDKIRRKLGIPAVGLDDRVATVCVLLGLHENEQRRLEFLSVRLAELGLTERERTIAFCLVSGAGYKEIGDRIHASLSTVKDASEGLRRKLGLPAVGKDDRVATVLNLLGL